MKTSVMSPQDMSDPRYMCRLRLGKTTTEFFSTRGNSRLKRIWTDNDLDEEMIFSSWIGSTKGVMKQNVSDYMQTFLIRRSEL